LNLRLPHSDYNRDTSEDHRLKADKQKIYQELLVLRCKRGDKQALAGLVRLWEKRLFYYVRRLVGTEEDAWDTLQRVWMKVLMGIKSLKNPRNLPTWLYRITRNTALSHLRERYKAQEHLDEGCDLGNAEVTEEAPCFEDVELVHHGLGQISLAHRDVLTLYFLQDLSIEEIAVVLAIPLGTVKSRLYHAKRALRNVLERKRTNHE